MIFAVLYLYRHTIELQLKYIIKFGVKLKVLSEQPECFFGHALLPIWEKARDVIKDGAAREELRKIANIVQQLHEVDPTGQEFRYGSTKSKKQSLKGFPNYVSTHSAQEQLCEIIDVLDIFIMGLEAHWDAENDMSEYG